MTLNQGSRRRGVSLPFLAGLIVLLATGGYLGYARATGRLYLIKKPAPLQKPLSELRSGALSPWQVRERTTLPDETIEELGTKLYIEWALEDSNPDAQPWARFARLFVTYYTGVQDQVPHVPEECSVQSGMSPMGSADLEFSLGANGRRYPVRRVIFGSSRGRARVYIYYTFVVNGDMYCDRIPVRARMAKVSEQYLYYSKVEVSFRGQDDEVPPAMDRTAERLLNQAISVLLTDHLPDVAAMERGSGAGGAPTNLQSH